jgi:thioredoxin-related protein
MIKVSGLFILTFLISTVFGQGKAPKSPMPWLTAEEAQIKTEQEKRPVLVDVYTDWCHYCKVMDATTWSNPQVKDYVTRNFYPVKFNAEGKEPVLWMGKTYEFKTTYKVHMLAAEWLQGNMVYPSTVILPPDGAEPIVIPGVMDVKDLEPILHYFAEKHYLSTSWKKFKAGYKSTWK